MGYTTRFKGQFHLDKPLAPAHDAYLTQFAGTRRMKRDPLVANGLPDSVRRAAHLPIGNDGAYFTGGLGFKGQERDISVLDSNLPPDGQPGLWCHWIPSAEGTEIIWDGGDKFYEYIPWLKYLIGHFLNPWGYTLNGQVTWKGEDADDKGVIDVVDNIVSSDIPSVVLSKKYRPEPESLPLPLPPSMLHGEVEDLARALFLEGFVAAGPPVVFASACFEYAQEFFKARDAVRKSKERSPTEVKEQ